jgi:hypothetical protein
MLTYSLVGLEVRGMKGSMIRQDGEPKVHRLPRYITKGIMIHYNGAFPQAGECLQRRSASNVCP